MVNVDEINSNIQKFGEVVEGLNKFEVTYSKVVEVSDQQNRIQIELRDFYANEIATLSAMKDQVNEIQLSMLKKLDDTQNNIRDRIIFTQAVIESQVNAVEKNLIQNLESSQNLIDTKFNEMREHISSEFLKALKIKKIIIVGIILILILQIINFFV